MIYELIQRLNENKNLEYSLSQDNINKDNHMNNFNNQNILLRQESEENNSGNFHEFLKQNKNSNPVNFDKQKDWTTNFLQAILIDLENAYYGKCNVKYWGKYMKETHGNCLFYREQIIKISNQLHVDLDPRLESTEYAHPTLNSRDESRYSLRKLPEYHEITFKTAKQMLTVIDTLTKETSTSESKSIKDFEENNSNTNLIMITTEARKLDDINVDTEKVKFMDYEDFFSLRSKKNEVCQIKDFNSYLECKKLKIPQHAGFQFHGIVDTLSETDCDTTYENVEKMLRDFNKKQKERESKQFIEYISNYLRSLQDNCKDTQQHSETFSHIKTEDEINTHDPINDSINVETTQENENQEKLTSKDMTEEEVKFEVQKAAYRQMGTCFKKLIYFPRSIESDKACQEFFRFIGIDYKFFENVPRSYWETEFDIDKFIDQLIETEKAKMKTKKE
jgi:hypothetical protein